MSLRPLKLRSYFRSKVTRLQPNSVSNLNAASGGAELGPETRLPDDEARAAIIGDKLIALPEPISSVDISILAAASRGLTGADLKAVVEDGKLLFANDKSKGKPLRPVEDY